MNMAEESPMDITYTYPTLPRSRCFRLLSIHSYVPHSRCKLHCSLETFRFGDSVDFDALSYTWGPPLATPECADEYSSDNDVTIYIESDEHHKGRASVGRNLFEALVQIYRFGTDPESSQDTMSDPDSARQTFSSYIWTDALCINQQDEDEKSSQVGYIAGIYGNATTVLAWLGRDDGTFDDIAWFHHDFLDNLMKWLGREPGLSLQDFSSMWLGFEAVEDGCRLSGPNLVLPDKILTSLLKFYTERRFLDRLWIRQELVLAQSVMVLCGSYIFPLWRFHECGVVIFNNQALCVRMIQMLSPSRVSSELNIDGSILSKVDDMRQSIVRFEDLRNGLENSIGRLNNNDALYCARLFMLIQTTYGSICQNPVDRVFGLIGMLHSNLPPDYEPLITPDYSKPSQRVYFETMALLLTHLPHMLALSCVNHPGDAETLQRPSWIPTYGFNASSEKEPSFLMTNAVHQGRSTFNASGRHLHSSKIDGFSDNELRLTGKFQGTILARPSPLSGSLKRWGELAKTEQRQIDVDYLLFVLETLQGFGRRYSTGESQGEAMIQTLAPGAYLEHSSNSSLEEGLHSFKSWVLGTMTYYTSTTLRAKEGELDEISSYGINQICTLLDELATTHEDFLPTMESITELRNRFDSRSQEEENPIAPYARSASAFLSAAQIGAASRRLFRTGSSVGLGPGAMRPGDEVWVVLPGRIPFILRPTDEQGRYLFVGEAYLHGIMFGEGVDALGVEGMQGVVLV